MIMEKDIICVCEVAQDIDDLVALEFLKRSGRLKGVVLDPLPKTQEDWKRVEKIKDLQIPIFKSIPYCKAIFVGGSFTSVARYLLMNKVEYIVANGGFVGANIVPEDEQLKKFKGKTHVRTFNFCMDVDSTLRVLSSKNVEHILLIGKNVCHDERNTLSGIWKNETWIKDYDVNDTKRLHDLLAYSEGLSYINGVDSDLLNYSSIYPEAININGNMTKFGSLLAQDSHILAATTWKN